MFICLSQASALAEGAALSQGMTHCAIVDLAGRIFDGSAKCAGSNCRATAFFANRGENAGKVDRFH
jgi:hypothetical protein